MGAKTLKELVHEYLDLQKKINTAPKLIEEPEVPACFVSEDEMNAFVENANRIRSINNQVMDAKWMLKGQRDDIEKHILMRLPYWDVKVFLGDVVVWKSGGRGVQVERIDYGPD